ncbi:hypothetical protein CPJCM30710_22650 [Clostridium polyendosporum]|uniref:YmaF family protein n=1 Tax=Clostridium polyendosporum TaxID=69208 RepID=A0A919S1A3_9CLOT|nr:YmaF family protein [Clostridium polyendosporum]GIM29599.1 hypothetical protein CPJCM30710_22650 [Clostridium polyendosporum]
MSKNRKKQRHVHEFLGSTRLAELEEDPHDHRFAGITSQAIGPEEDHIHIIKARTDFFDHFHEIMVQTGPPIIVNPEERDPKKRRHVHFVEGETTCNDGHRHEFIFATLIEAPTFEEKDC